GLRLRGRLLGGSFRLGLGLLGRRLLGRSLALGRRLGGRLFRRRLGGFFGCLVLLVVRHWSLSSGSIHVRCGWSGCGRSPAWRASAAPDSPARPSPTGSAG